MSIGRISILAFFHCILFQAVETGNSLVTCSACQTIQAQIDNWSCDINCKVANGNNGKYLNLDLCRSFSLLCFAIVNLIQCFLIKQMHLMRIEGKIS